MWFKEQLQQRADLDKNTRGNVDEGGNEMKRMRRHEQRGGGVSTY